MTDERGAVLVTVAVCMTVLLGAMALVVDGGRLRVERTFAWEDKFKRLLLRFERIQQRHYGMKLMAYTLINLRAFCGA